MNCQVGHLSKPRGKKNFFLPFLPERLLRQRDLEAAEGVPVALVASDAVAALQVSADAEA